ncbi:hypothetical protein [Streptomyces sp. NPDC057253]|uniref:hypothetical protein n=1 Tax=Streptomyces sp. NPDC057253 TaxID=3346069 RepID=UPI00363281B2
MEFVRRGFNSVKRRYRTAAAVGALAVGASLLAAPQALAADQPTPRQLLDACSWADVCDFHPQSYWTYTGPRHQVGSSAFNCGSTTNQHAINWSDTTGSSNTFGVAISQSVKFETVFESEITLSYSHSWQTSHTDSETDTVNIPAGHVGWIERGTAKQQAKGWYELHFGKPYYGHYIWYLQNYQASGFNADNPHAGYINFKDRAMTSGERQTHCR